MSKDYGLGQCSFEGCENPAIKRGWLCGGHKTQYYRGKPLTPLGYKRLADIGLEGWRRCTTCFEVKQVDDFYIRQTGIRQSKCKRCFIRAVQEAQRRRREAANDDSRA